MEEQQGIDESCTLLQPTMSSVTKYNKHFKIIYLIKLMGYNLETYMHMYVFFWKLIVTGSV